MSGARAWPLLLVAPACAPQLESFAIPQLETGLAGTVILLQVPSPSAPDGITGSVYDGSRFLVEPRVIESSPFLVLFEEPPEALFLPIGPIAHDPAQVGRLRRPHAAYALQSGVWTPDTRLMEGVLKALRFTAAPGDACAEMRGCLERRDELEPVAPLYCARACEPFEIASPAPPAKPVADCAPGFTLDRGEIDRCDTSAARCPAGTRAELGGACVDVGRGCPSDDYAEPPPNVAVVYVSASAQPGGDGTRARPYTLADALAQADPGAALMLSKGEHRVITAPLDVRLIGACAQETIVFALNTRVDAPAELTGLDLRTRTFQVRHALQGNSALIRLAPGFASRISGEGRVTLDDVVLTATAPSALIVEGGLSGSRVELSEVRLDIRNGTATVTAAVLRSDAPAIDVEGRGRARVDGSLVEVATEDAAINLSGARAVVTRSRIRAQHLVLSARAETAEAFIGASYLSTTNALETAAVEAREKARLTMSDVVANDAVEVRTGASALIDRFACLECKGSGIYVRTARLTAADLLLDVSDEPVPEGRQELPGFAALRVELGAYAEISRVRIRGPATYGFSVDADPGSPEGAPKVVVSDIEVSDSLNAGIWLEGGTNRIPPDPQLVEASVVGIARAHLHDVEGTALGYEHHFVKSIVDDLRIERVRPANGARQLERCAQEEASNSCAGVGLYMSFPAVHQLDLERFSIEGYAASAMDLSVSVTVRGTLGHIGEGRVGVIGHLWRKNDSAFSQVHNGAIQPEIRR